MKLAQIQQNVGELTEEEYKAFCVWFENYQADQWDRQIERDALAGKFDRIFEEISAEVRRGEIQPL